MADEKSETQAPKTDAGYFGMKRILVDPAAAPTVAHHIMWTRIGHEYTLEVGHFDSLAVREAIKKGAKPVAPPRAKKFLAHLFSHRGRFSLVRAPGVMGHCNRPFCGHRSVSSNPEPRGLSFLPSAGWASSSGGGNQQISPRVLGQVGPDNIIIIAARTRSKPLSADAY